MIQLGILETDPNWTDGNRSRGITRRFMLAIAIMTIGIVLIGLPLVFTGIALITPTPFYYRNLPFTVCRPVDTQTVPGGQGSPGPSCTPQRDNDAFKPGDVVPFLVDRCAQDIFGGSTSMAYVVSRNVVNDQTQIRTILPGLATNVQSNGCTIAVTYAHQLPAVLPPGRYYIEGVATVYGRFKTVNSYFRTDVFTVIKSDAGDSS